MFTCFGRKSSSEEDVSERKKTSTGSHKGHKANEFRKTSKEIKRRNTSVTHHVTTHKFTRQTSLEYRSNSNVMKSLGEPRSLRTNIDSMLYRFEPPDTPESPPPKATAFIDRIRDQNQGTSSVKSIKPKTTQHISNTTPKKYKVRKTNKFYDNVRGNFLPVYQTHSAKRGEALIINNVKFCKEKSERRGAIKDENDINDVLQQIGFKVEKHQNKKKNEIKKILKQFTSRRKKLEEADICLIVIMSHGTNNNIPGGYTEILCVDGERISTEDIIDYFNASSCQFLKDKPKIFIFQCCRNKLYEKDAIPIPRKPEDKSNTLIAYSTVPGFASNRDIVNGTWYIQTICKIFSIHAHEYHIEDLLTMVDREMKQIDPHMKQVSCFENRGFSRCYLHPH